MNEDSVFQTSTLEEIFANSEFGMAFLNAKGFTIHSNYAFEQMVSENHKDFFRKRPSHLDIVIDKSFPAFRYEYQIKHENGTETWLEIAVSYISETHKIVPENTVAVALAVDITKRKNSVDKYVYETTHDGLTNLVNRPKFLEELGITLSQSKRSSSAILFMDLDDFKPVNDTFGHAAGDQLLCATADRLRELAGTQHLAARFHGDEFGFLLRNVNLEQAMAFGNQVRSEMLKPFNLGIQQVSISSSIGVVLIREDHLLEESVLQDADAAMYSAKRNGRSRVELFDESMRNSKNREARLRTDVRSGVKRGEFRMLYQPIVELSSGRMHGIEALMRWHHPIEGEIGPNEFIPLAEKSEAIIDLGFFALRESCTFLSNLDRIDGGRRRHTVSINLAVRQILEPNLTEQIRKILEEHNLPGNRIMLEVTESAMLNNEHKVADVFAGLKKMGIRLCIDDFGTGYSSLRYLHQFPIDLIKLDRTFVSDGGDAVASEPIVEMIVNLAKSLNMGVIAEGVETNTQKEILRALECSLGQGYLFSPPIAPRELVQWLGLDPTLYRENKQNERRSIIKRVIQKPQNSQQNPQGTQSEPKE